MYRISHVHAQKVESSACAKWAHCLLELRRAASQVALSRARSRYGWSFGLIFVLEMRGVSSYEYVREKDKQGTGAKQRWAKLGPVGRYM